MKRKTIGVPGYIYKEGSFGVGPNHLEFINQFGNPRIIMPWEELAEVDALYLAGGLDINPSSYGAIPGFHTSNTDVHKQFFFDKRLRNYVKKSIGIFGVCAGFQTLGAFFGSILTQHLMYHPQSENRGEAGHNIIILEKDGTYITVKNKKGEDIPKYQVPVNSHHHQGILLDNLGKDLQALAIYEDADGPLVEIFRHNTLPIAAIQAHPEEMYIDLAVKLFEEILENQTSDVTTK